MGRIFWPCETCDEKYMTSNRSICHKCEKELDKTHKYYWSGEMVYRDKSKESEEGNE